MAVVDASTVDDAQSVEELREFAKQLIEVIARQDAEITQQQHHIQQMLAELRLWRHRMFGRKSEVLHPGQLRLFEAGEASEPEPPQDPPAAEPPKKKAKKKGHGRGSFPEHLPRQDVPLELSKDARCCSECGDVMQPIGDDVSERGHIVPARMVVLRYKRTKYACRKGHGVKMAPMPDGVIDGGKYEASVHAHVAVAKYADHMPLNRLEGIFRRFGVHLPRQTMWEMLARVDEIVAQPVLAQMRKELLEEGVLHADETPVTLRVEGKSGGSRTGFMYVWRNLRELETSKVLIDFRPNRAKQGPKDFLGNWTGSLIADAYSGYHDVCVTNDITRSGCWSHARRKFKEALDTGVKAAIAILALMHRLFWIERAINKRAADRQMTWTELIALREDVRTRLSARVIDAIHAEAEKLSSRRDVLPKSRIGEALTYLRKQAGPLSEPLRDPRLPIHNNDAERTLRHIAVGRKNWMVFASDRGAGVAARLYSLVLTCREIGIDPEAYIEDLLGRVATTKATDIASLTPWAWAAEREEPAGGAE